MSKIMVSNNERDVCDVKPGCLGLVVSILR